MTPQGIHYDMYFYKDGFFGYGEDGDFVQWSLAHLAPIIVMLAGILLIWLFRKRLRSWRHEETARYWLGFSILMCEIGYYWRLLYVGPADPAATTFMDRLPLQVCEWTAMICFFALLKKSPMLFDITYFLAVSTSVLPLLFPAVITNAGPTYFRYYQFWGEHILPIWGMFYLMIVHKMRPRPRGIALAFVMLALLAGFAMVLNPLWKECNYLYLKPGDYEMLSFLPNSPFAMIGLYVLVLVPLMTLAYQPWRLQAKKLGKHKTS